MRVVTTGDRGSSFDPTSELMRDLTEVPGLIFEFGGPTPGGYPGLDMAALADRLIVSNLFSGLPKWSAHPSDVDIFERVRPPTEIDRRTARRRGAQPPDYVCGQVQLVADVTQAPLRSGSVAGVLASCLPKDIRDSAIREAGRILKPGGLLIWRGNINVDNDLRSARAVGLFEHSRPERGCFVWKKPSDRSTSKPA
ncbi:MAG: class I SAM-dependent methyltransferase [Myxococcota bacterium]